MPLLSILAIGCFVSSMAMRITDPAVPDIARDLAVTAAAVAMLTTAFSLPYALGQPILGALGDGYGKSKVIKASLVLLAFGLAACALAPTFATLTLARFFSGAAGGGIIAMSFAMVGDRYAMDDRQVMLSRLLSAIIAGQVTGTLGGGWLAAEFGWRTAVAASAAIAAIAAVLSLVYLTPRPKQNRPPVNFTSAANGYRRVFANPRARICFAAVVVEGIVIFGLFPYLAVLLEQRGAGSVREAGFVLAGFAVGGFIYTGFARSLVRSLGRMNLMRYGALLSALGLVLITRGTSWPVEAGVFVALGMGFYMIHNSLQTEATEFVPEARGSAVAAHAFFFFLAQAAGPILYRLGFDTIGETNTLVVAAMILAFTGLMTAAALTRLSRGQH